MNPVEQFEKEKLARIEKLKSDTSLDKLAHNWVKESMEKQYVYNFSWMGRPIIQYPEDVFAIQEIIWEVKPDLIIETGVAHGGSIVFSASMLQLLGKGKVIGIDIDIRKHNRDLIESHPMSHRIELIEGSSISEQVGETIAKEVAKAQTVLVILDSMHTHEHVIKELELYAPFVTKNSYCIVLDSFVEDMPKGYFKDRPWDVGNNPKTAIHQYLKQNTNFVIDDAIHNKLKITVAPDGYLKRVK